MRRLLVACAILGAAQGSACAGETPLYQPAPAWVIPAPPPAPDKGEASAFLIFDEQQRFKDGRVYSYSDVARRIASEQMLTRSGTINLAWEPYEGDLIVHRVEIERGGRTIDLLGDGEKLTVIRRELGLEALQLTGELTATMSVKGLRVGDVLRTTYTVTRLDPELKGRLDMVAGLIPDQTAVGFARVRLLWPATAKVRWHALAKLGAVKERDLGGEHELTVAMPLPKQEELPADAPQRYQPMALIEATTFRDWPDVSRTMAPLFRPVRPSEASPLAAEIARIRAAAPDARTRTALALRSVQDNVRYFAITLDHGGLTPQTAEKTWSVRYGDCKAKTLLLLTMLDGLGVPAEPALANLGQGDMISKRLPSAAAFNHIIVRANVDGRPLLLEGTASGDRLVDIGDSRNYRNLLPLTQAGATLLAVPAHANARPNAVARVSVDQSAGIGIPAPITVSVTFAGGFAEQLKAMSAQVTGDRRKQLIDSMAAAAGQPVLVVTRAISFDDANATATIKVTGVTPGRWQREDQRYEEIVDNAVSAMHFDGDRGRPEWRQIPVATGGVISRMTRLEMTLPDGGRGFALEGDRTLPQMLAGVGVHRVAAMDGGVVTVEDRADATAVEIAPADIADTRAKLALAQTRRLKLIAPRDYPARWKIVRDARRNGRLQPIEAAFTATIADATEKPPQILNRAMFHASVFDWQAAIADLDRVVATRPTAQVLLVRATLLFGERQDARALADARAAYALDPGSIDTTGELARMLVENGQTTAAMALLDEAIAAGGERKAGLLARKADLLTRAGQTLPALAAIDAAIAAKPGDPMMLNNRCWAKAILGVQLDTALKDCTKAIELGADTGAVLDSRALVFFKMGRMDDALTDINAALDQRPDGAGSLYLRGAIEAKQGAQAKSADDLAGARLESPRVDEEYTRYGVHLS